MTLLRLAAFASLSILFFAGCAHHNDVRPGANGIHRVSLHGDDPDEAAQDAIRQANHYCGEKNKEAAFIDENRQYTGSMDEKSYKNAKTASKVAEVVGGTVWALGGKNESALGGVVGLGGAATNAALGKGYKTEMQFKCQ